MTVKILHTADWHIGNFPGPEAGGHNLRADDTGMCINHLRDVALLRRPDVILISGDIFHQARVWADRGLSEVRVAIQAIETLAETCPVVVMRGTPNHDGEEQFSMLQAHFLHHPHVTVQTTPGVLRLTLPNGEDLNVACLPGFDRGVFRAKFPGLSKEEENQVFTDELGKIVLGLRAQCQPGAPSVLMAHYTVPGCNTESGQTQFLAQFEPVLLPEVLDSAAFDLVALGHIHRPQQVPSCQNVFYSGAINAMNFNDEGQERGFFIHELPAQPAHIPGSEPPIPAAVHDFYTTPARGFQTIRLGPDEIGAYLSGGFEMIASASVYEAKGKIVRVLYSCDEDQNKALNRAELERELVEQCGAFWVSEISPEKVTIGTNKDELSERTDPERNLVLYLQDRGTPDEQTGEIVELARPIIAAATAGNVTSQFSGAFIPLSIEVKNYRNYAEEHFDFSDISFCTINGRNGVGKSSLFMDAILDCLYEEPREGDLTGWIRADEKARSGSIAFTFSIGGHTFRVVRTRAKSGKATLNLSELVDGEWQNRSAEKIKDTQETIVNILGMDSLTFRSCALIMQDQYGLFLQASKEDRMTILGNILGLGLYGDMEQIARSCASDVNRQIAKHKTAIETMSADLSDADAVDEELEALFSEAEQARTSQDAAAQAKENLAFMLSARRQAATRAASIREGMDTTEGKKRSLRLNMEEQEGILRSANETLAAADTIRTEAAKHEANLAELSGLQTSQAALHAKLEPLAECANKVENCKISISSLERQRTSSVELAADHRQKIAQVEQFAEAAKEAEAVSAAISEMEEREREYSAAVMRHDEAQRRYAAAKSDFNLEAQSRKNRILICQEQVKMLENSGCVDVENASCRFLANAKASKDELDTLLPESTKWREEQEAALRTLEAEVEALAATISDIHFHPDDLRNLRSRFAELSSRAAEYEKIHLFQDMLAQDEATIADLDAHIDTAKKRLDEAVAEAAAAEDMRRQLSDLSAKISTVKCKVLMSEAWVEKKNALPLAEERKQAAERRIKEIQADIDELSTHLVNLQQEYVEAKRSADGIEDLEAQLRAAQFALDEHERYAQEIHTKIGGLQTKVEQFKARRAEIQALQAKINDLAHTGAIYEALKVAFSQDGIPHNIIRSMLPMLTATANSILGQMTGGKMGMEFITDKVLKSNSKKEVPTLDIIIEEYGKDSLPYLSKSGGEKVKASLSAILALAEIKSSQAGIQLGMLFIDEPPFLDGEGIQAYCDALETIQRRYQDLKVMAITHDPTMKARFPQSIDVVKTPEGSRVEVS